MLIPLALGTRLETIAPDLASSALDTRIACGDASGGRIWTAAFAAFALLCRARSGGNLERVVHGKVLL